MGLSFQFVGFVDEVSRLPPKLIGLVVAVTFVDELHLRISEWRVRLASAVAECQLPDEFLEVDIHPEIDVLAETVDLTRGGSVIRPPIGEDVFEVAEVAGALQQAEGTEDHGLLP